MADLLLRTDATVAIGTGHVMRCLALAQAWQDRGGRSIFVMAEADPATEERLRAENMQVLRLASVPGSMEDAAKLVALAREHRALWAVVDGYQFDAEYQRALHEASLKTLFVDDNGEAESYCADVVLNQNAYADGALYARRDPSTQLLLGCRYALLRREFASWRHWRRKIPERARKLLVSLGGSDPDNFSREVIEATRQFSSEILETTVIVGGSNPHFEKLQSLDAVKSHRVKIVRNVTNMAEWMAWADFAIAGAGTVCLELCLLGLPAVLIDLAENQVPIARKFSQLGTAAYLGSSRTVKAATIAAELEQLRVSQERRTMMSERGQELVDGLGTARVLDELIGAESP